LAIVEGKIDFNQISAKEDIIMDSEALVAIANAL
jgi:hypothetical protein